MTSVSQIQNPAPFFSRETKNDIHLPVRREGDAQNSATQSEPTATELIARTALVALPLLSQIKPLSFPLALGMGGVRVVTCVIELASAIQELNAGKIAYQLLQTAIAVVALAATIFAHPIGMLITTGHDILIEFYNLFYSLYQGEYFKALEACFHILQNALYLALWIVGGLEIAIAALLVQILVCLYSAYSEFAEGRYLEAIGQVLMSLVRGSQLVQHAQLLSMRWEIEKAFAEIHAKLGEKYQFGSDHLPVGTKIGNGTFITFNVLDSDYMSWVTEKDSQGINGSLVTQLDKPDPKNPKITLRESLIIQYIQTMIANHPGAVIALQECRGVFTEALLQALPSFMGSYLGDPTLKRDQEILLFDQRFFSLVAAESRIVYDAFPCDGRTLMDVVLRERATGIKFQMINTHLPGDPAKPGRNEFARYVLTNGRIDCITLPLGDCNFEPHEMEDAFTTEAAKLGITSPYVDASGQYNTNIHPFTYRPKKIDYVFVQTEALKRAGLTWQAMAPNDILPGLQDTVDLLTPEVRRRMELTQQEERDEAARVEAAVGA